MVECFITERMWVAWAKHHKVGYINDADTQIRNILAQNSGSSNDFECYFDTDTNEDTMGFR